MTIAPAITAFLASGVELVEALTIVLAVGIAAGWSRALGGALGAVIVLAAIVALAGPHLVVLIESPIVRIVVGAVALYVGATWLRKAILRAAGKKAMRDENAVYVREVEAVRERGSGHAVAAAFNGVFLEGVEVVAIVLAVGAAGPAALGAATWGALTALALVVVAGLLVHRPLARVPENAMKYAVGVALTSFGIFWVGEGTGVRWYAADVALFYLAALVLVLALGTTAMLRRRTA